MFSLGGDIGLPYVGVVEFLKVSRGHVKLRLSYRV